MSLFRANTLRSLQTSIRQSGARATARSANPYRTQLVAKRFASSGGHGEHAASSDLPWLLGGIAVTIPSCYYLWPSSSHAEGGHHDSDHGAEHDDKHEEKEEEEEEEAPAKEESSEAPAEEEKPADEGDDSAKESDGEDSKEDSGDEDGAKEADGPDDKKKSKGKVSADSEGADDTRKVESDEPKGVSKKRIDSGLAKNLGEGSSSQEPLSSTSKKQAGMSNTDTKHSIQIDEDSEKSKKGEGAPETAKLKGAVDPSRPQK